MLKLIQLLDGHDSYVELPFLQYINNLDYEWVVSIGVSYGTSYWLAWDSSTKNGSY